MQKEFQYNDSTISYRVEGEGIPVVLIHGFGEDSSIFDDQIAFLKSHCLLIVPDLPGSAKSEILTEVNEAIISIEDYASCIKALIEKEKITKCIMLGHSMGGYITLAFAELYPQLLSGFGLVHSTAFADNEEKKINRKRGIELIEEFGAYAYLKNTIPNLFAKKYKDAFPEKVASLIEASKQFTKKACQQYLSIMMNRPDRTSVLKGNLLPVLFVIGTEDVAAPMSDVLQQTHLPECSHIHILENVGHMSMWEATSQLNIHLLDFISR